MKKPEKYKKIYYFSRKQGKKHSLLYENKFRGGLFYEAGYIILYPLCQMVLGIFRLSNQNQNTDSDSFEPACINDKHNMANCQEFIKEFYKKLLFFSCLLQLHDLSLVFIIQI